MKQTSKLKPIRWVKANIMGIIAAAVFFTVFASIRAMSQKETADVLSGLLYIGITVFLVFLWFKSHHFHVLPLILMILLFAVHFFNGIQNIVIIANVFLLILLIYIISLFLKHSFLHLRILDLASKSVTGAENGFTNRPLFSGKSEYSQGEIIGFANFLEQKTIAIPYQDSGGIVLSFPEDWLGRKYEVHGSYLDDTRVNFDNELNVSAVISQKDYKKYKDELTFDQLCESLGKLFIEFLEYYKSGDTDKILNRIKKRS